MNAVLITLRFNPGHLSHIVANEKLLTESGVDVKVFCHEKYRSHYPAAQFINWRDALRFIRKLRAGDLVVIWFPSLGALFYQILLRIFTKATIVYVYHEPYQSFSAYLSSGFGVGKTIRISLVSGVSLFLCLLSHKIILPSERAFSQVKSARLQPSRYRKINLMFDDESEVLAPRNRQMDIAYIGTIAEDHAFDEFIRFAQRAVETGSLKNYRFVIATRSELPACHKMAVDYCVNAGRMKIQSGRPLTNEEINEYYSSCRIVWNAYRRSMQSGVLPKAYMFSTPVIVTESNPSEYFLNRNTGFMISADYRFDEFCQAVEDISLHWDAYSKNCRAVFYEAFHYRSLARSFMNFVSGDG